MIRLSRWRTAGTISRFTDNWVYTGRMTILGQLSSATDSAASAEKKKRALICRALEKGIPSRVVAEAAGMSHQGVLKIWKREQEREQGK